MEPNYFLFFPIIIFFLLPDVAVDVPSKSRQNMTSLGCDIVPSNKRDI